MRVCGKWGIVCLLAFFGFVWFLLRHAIGQNKIKVNNEMLLESSRSMWSLASLVLMGQNCISKTTVNCLHVVILLY